MIDFTKNIVNILTQAKEEIQANMASNNINASGRTSRGFMVERYNEGVRLILSHEEKKTIVCGPRPPKGLSSVVVSAAPLSTLQIGRPGGKVPRGFYYIIKEWSREKDIQFATEQERQTFAYFLARKIAKNGTQRNTNHKQVYDEPIQKAIDRLNAIFKKDMRALLLGEIKTATTR